MTTVGDMMDRIFAFIQSADLRTVVDVVVIAMIVWFIIRLFETIVLGGLSLYAISEMARYLGIEVDYPALFSQISEAIQNLLAFINTHLPG